MVKMVIASVLIYYFGLSFWWWIALFIALVIDIYEGYVTNINDVKTVNNLEEIILLLKDNKDNS